MATPWKSVCFLHGLASSPQGTKALYFGERFAEEELPYVAPDLNVPDFTHQTLSAQLQRVEEAVAGLPGPVLLMGSSLGGLAAIRYAELHPEQISGVAVIAPVLEVQGARLAALAGSTAQKWKEAGVIRLERDGQQALLAYDLIQDAASHVVRDVVLKMPLLAIHGTLDDLVPWEETDRFVCRQHDGSSSILVNGDHSLNNHLELMWTLLGNWRTHVMASQRRGKADHGHCNCEHH